MPDMAHMRSEANPESSGGGYTLDSPQTFTRKSFKLFKRRFCPETRALPLTLSRKSTTKRPNRHKLFMSGKSLFQRQSLVLPGVPSSGKGLDTAQQSPPGAPDTHQVQMIKNQGWFVHLTQDQQHFIVYKFLEFLQVAVHVLLQLIPDLQTQRMALESWCPTETSGGTSLQNTFHFFIKNSNRDSAFLGDQEFQYVASLQ